MLSIAQDDTFSVNSTQFSSFTKERREPSRPAEFRETDFFEKFDADTLFFDSFRRMDGKVVLMGPPLAQFMPIFKQMIIEAGPTSKPCTYHIRKLDRHSQILVEASANIASLQLKTSIGDVGVEIGENQLDVFRGRRVMLTLSKNNQLHWIKNWVTFGRDHHGADAVLIYDNNSTLYSSKELLDTIKNIKGIKAARVIDWPFKYGPQGDAQGRFWDSDFCQYGAWEHARWRFLSKARSVLNSDVDELVLSKSTGSVFQSAETDLFGVVRYPGRWVVGTDKQQTNFPDNHHTDYTTVMKEKPQRKFGLFKRDSAGCPCKWVVVPHKCPQYAQWGVHSILNWLPAKRSSSNFSYRHFREINDGWKYARTGRQAFDPNTHEEDELLKAHFAVSHSTKNQGV